MTGVGASRSPATDARLIRVLALSLLLGTPGCGGNEGACRDECRYFGQQPPGCTAEIFGPGILSTDMHDDGAPAFSPAGDEIYTRVFDGQRFSIRFLTREGDGWSRPRRASFSDESVLGRIALAPDGQRMYFSSDRPAEDRGEDRTDFDIWYVDRVDDGWGTPVHLGPEVNSPLDELDMSVDSSLTLYFNREGSGAGVDDILRAEYRGGRYAEAVPLEPPLNSARVEAAPLIAPDGSFLVFLSEARAGSRGSLDLYVSFRNPDGSWTEPRNLGDGVNTRYDEKFASLTPDGRYLLFTSNRPRSWSYGPEAGSPLFRSAFERAAFYNRPPVQPYYVDIYWVSTEVIHNPDSPSCASRPRDP